MDRKGESDEDEEKEPVYYTRNDGLAYSLIRGLGYAAAVHSLACLCEKRAPRVPLVYDIIIFLSFSCNQYVGITSVPSFIAAAALTSKDGRKNSSPFTSSLFY